MIKISSRDSYNQLKDTLSSTLESLEVMYYSLQDEIRAEIINKKEIREKEDEETKEIYHQLSYELCQKIIHDSLPLRVRLFNKIICRGYGIRGIGLIHMYFQFNDYGSSYYTYEIDISKIKKYI